MSFGTSLFGYIVSFDRDGEVLKGVITDQFQFNKAQRDGTFEVEIWFVVMNRVQGLFLVLPSEILDYSE